MTLYEKRALLLELLFRKSGLSLPELVEDPEFLEDLIQAVFDDLQQSRAELRGQVAALQTRNRHLEQYVDMVAHNLKEPLAEAPFETVHKTEVVANVQGRLSHQIREQQAQVVLPEEGLAAIGYGPRIEEVWANYLCNALKFGGRPPYVELGALARSEGVAHFWVRDNGPGIPPAARNHLFTAFNHVGHGQHLEHGLGLSIILRIVEKMGGQVGVESEPGTGSLFYFTLPADSSPRERMRVSHYAK